MTDWVPVVDISKHQGVVNFHVMRSKGVRGLILRISHGLVLDSMVESYYPQAVDAGFDPADIGFYPFINPKRSSGADAAAFAVEAITRIIGHRNFFYMIDVENYKEESPNVGQAPVFGAQFAAHIRDHIGTVRGMAPAARVFGYSNRAYWNGKIYKGSVIEWVGDDQLAAELDWIVARYPVYSLVGYAAKPLPPDSSGWDEWAFKAAPDGPFPPRGADWEAWQFSAGFNRQGQAYGVSSSDLDLNIVHPDAWAKWTAAPPPPNPQPEDDMELRLITLSDSDAQFLAETTTDGRTYNVRWVGTPALSAMRDAHKGAATSAGKVFVQPQSVAWLINTCLTGPLPTGDSKHTWTGAEFAAFDKPAAGVVDQVARDGVALVSADLADVDAAVDKIKAGLIATGS